MSQRSFGIERNTKETQIKCNDWTWTEPDSSDIETGVGFFDHMLDGFTRHGLFDLNVKVKGDLQVDDHHTIEDTGIVLGTCDQKKQSVTKRASARYGSCILPMDEALVLCAS